MDALRPTEAELDAQLANTLRERNISSAQLFDSYVSHEEIGLYIEAFGRSGVSAI